MNWDRIEGQWKQARGRIREQWGKLTDDHLEVIAGRHDKLLGALQANHGLARDGTARREQRDDDDIRRIARENADLIGR
ncbi:MAG: CsbD family protein [Burkholderiales bacterium]|nr:CsbD family protein [Burkholderiales bacterium]